MDEARDDLFVGTFINLKASVSPFAGTVKTYRKKVSYFGIAIINSVFFGLSQTKNRCNS